MLHGTGLLLLALVPTIQIVLPYFKSPVQTGLAYDWTDLWLLVVFVVIIFLDSPHARTTILFEKGPLESPRLAHTFPPATDLPFVVITSPPLEESAVPLKPPSYIVLMADPASRLPLFDTLPTSSMKFVDLRVVLWVRQILLQVQPLDPLIRHRILPIPSITIPNFLDLKGRKYEPPNTPSLSISSGLLFGVNDSSSSK